MLPVCTQLSECAWAASTVVHRGVVRDLRARPLLHSHATGTCALPHVVCWRVYSYVAGGGDIEEGSEPREHRRFNGVDYVMEEGITGDFALIKAWKADEAGNLVFRKTARNFNEPMAKAGRITVAEVEEIVPVGELDPDHIHVPGIFVNRVVLVRSNAPRCADANAGLIRQCLTLCTLRAAAPSQPR